MKKRRFTPGLWRKCTADRQLPHASASEAALPTPAEAALETICAEISGQFWESFGEKLTEVSP